MKRFREKSRTINAIQYTGDISALIPFFMSGQIERSNTFGKDFLVIWTIEGAMSAFPGCWIVLDHERNVYPVAESLFNKLYDEEDI